MTADTLDSKTPAAYLFRACHSPDSSNLACLRPLIAPPSGSNWIHEIKHDGYRLMSRYRSGRSRDWIKMKNPACPAVKREAEEDWGR